MTVRYEPAERDDWSYDPDGTPFAVKHYDDRLTYDFDLADWLGSDTVDTVTWHMYGPTKIADSTTTTRMSVTITGVGDAEAVVVTTAGQERTFGYRWKAMSRSPRGYGR